jgi:hypothetical protein
MLDMLQVFQRHVANVSEICSKYFICPNVCCKRSDLDVAYVLHICYNNMFQMFESYITVSVFMLQVANILFECCICLTHTLQVYVQMFRLLHRYVVFKCLMLHIFHVVRRRSDGGTTRVPWNVVRRATG